MLYKVNSNQIIVCSVSFHLLIQKIDKLELLPQLNRWSLKYNGVQRPKLHGVSCRLSYVAALWMGLYSVSGTGALDGFKGAVNGWLLMSLSCLCLSVAQVLVGLRNQYRNNSFYNLGLCCWF